MKRKLNLKNYTLLWNHPYVQDMKFSLISRDNLTVAEFFQIKFLIVLVAIKCHDVLRREENNKETQGQLHLLL